MQPLLNSHTGEGRASGETRVGLDVITSNSLCRSVGQGYAEVLEERLRRRLVLEAAMLTCAPQQRSLVERGAQHGNCEVFGPSDACFKLIDRHPADGDPLHGSSPSFRDVLHHPIHHQPLRQVRRRSAVPMVSQAAPIALLGPTDVGYSTRSPVREQMDATLIRCVYGPAPKIDLLLGRGRLEQMGRAWSRRAPPLWTHLLERHCPRVSEEFVQIASHAS